ncbi:hypothetical protein L596_011974 [Steinernema carpocapsae]|uniref:Uncharacterized protein n=1 Tax=Steinernema carpocapsae TaxID=34508 RepID=A0A4U5NWG8_STECR|nr:hypothetical protein L596_011974 [Steinernema carpocapsae]
MREVYLLPGREDGTRASGDSRLPAPQNNKTKTNATATLRQATSGRRPVFSPLALEKFSRKNGREADGVMCRCFSHCCPTNERAPLQAVGKCCTSSPRLRHPISHHHSYITAARLINIP